MNLSKNSTKTIRLFVPDFYEVIVNSAFGLIDLVAVHVHQNQLEVAVIKIQIRS